MLLPEPLESAKDRRSHRLENIPYRRENCLDDSPRGNEEILDLLECVLNGLPHLVGVNTCLFEHRTEQRVIALHEVHEVLDQQCQNDDGRRDGDDLEVDGTEAGFELAQERAGVLQEANHLVRLARYEERSNRDSQELQ